MAYRPPLSMPQLGQTAIAHRLIEHRSQHNSEARDCDNQTALHYASGHGRPLMRGVAHHS